MEEILSHIQERYANVSETQRHHVERGRGGGVLARRRFRPDHHGLRRHETEGRRDLQRIGRDRRALLLHRSGARVRVRRQGRASLRGQAEEGADDPVRPEPRHLQVGAGEDQVLREQAHQRSRGVDSRVRESAATAGGLYHPRRRKSLRFPARRENDMQTRREEHHDVSARRRAGQRGANVLE